MEPKDEKVDRLFEELSGIVTDFYQKSIDVLERNRSSWCACEEQFVKTETHKDTFPYGDTITISKCTKCGKEKY